MGGIALDPIGYSEALQKAGMPKAQADVIAKTQEARLDQLARARDLATRKDLAEMEARLTRAMYNALFGFACAIAAFLAVFIAMLK